MSCLHCLTPLPDGSRFCHACGQPADSGESNVATVLSDDATRLSSPTPRPPTSSPHTSQSGWLSSSGSIDHGRFAIGTVLDNRYRVLGLLGRGGMGEVYRADDLRLGQQVALKFLPVELSRDPVRLAQFHNEVRTARQVSHPNVCRVYDIGEIDGQLFITMEYMDGEDLAILLRRIGRLPEDKALEIARQIGAGLAAAHERGILHRDLKPANIMLDGAGKVRLMDFSLAAVGEVTDIRAGTPAYMAPEQLSGREVTVSSDIYALGLVLYELFTGRRAFDAKTITELVEQHQSGTLTAPTTIVKTLDPAIEMAIVRCLDRDPARRPASALRVSASLPGGDPLAAALAAGETPSPEMVAAAGGDSAMITSARGVLWLVASAALVLTVAYITARSSLLVRIPLSKSSAVLADRAEELRESLGFTGPIADRASGFAYDQAYLQWVEDHVSGSARWTDLPSGRPAAVRFWYRTSPQPLIPVNRTGSVNTVDPPVQLNGMTSIALDTRGRLLRFEAPPPQLESALNAPPAAADWQKLWVAAGLDPSTFSPAAPSRTPATYADERKAWAGVLPETKTPVTIEAAAYRGRPVLFEVVGPWTASSREPQGRPQSSGNSILILLLLTAAAVTAYVNVRRGHADRRGAFRLATFTFFMIVSLWVVNRHVSDLAGEQDRFFLNVAVALFVAGALYLLYLGLEPFVRRSWPTMLVGWSRLLAGRVRDPLIGHDILIGVACGGALALVTLASTMLRPKLGLSEPTPHAADLGAIVSTRAFIGTLVGCLNAALQNALITVFEFASLRALFDWVFGKVRGWAGRRWAWAGALATSDAASERVFVALTVAVATILAIFGNAPVSQRLLNASYQAVSTTLVVLVLLRIGIFGSAVMFFAQFLLLRVPFTFDGNALYATAAWFTLAGLLGLAAAGFFMARQRIPDH